MSVNEKIKDVLTRCQSGNYNTQALVSELTKIYKELDKKVFESSFIWCLKKFLIVWKKEPQVERGLDFVSKFVTSLKVEPKPNKSRKINSNKMQSSPDDDEEEEEMHPFQLKIFQFLIEHHNASSKAVRYRSCQLINALLADLGEGAQIDNTLFDSIHDMMLERVRDISHLVRYQAVLGMRRLQEPENPQCPIVEIYLKLMSLDKNPVVRRAALCSIAVTQRTLHAVLKRTRDMNENVRRLAYKVTAEKIHIKAMRIADRITLIQRGLNDDSEMVREACLDILVKAWLEVLDENVLKLLDCLDCLSYKNDCEILLFTLIKKKNPATLISESNIFDERHCIPIKDLTVENAFFWRCLCQHLQSLGSEQEELLDKILPTCITFVDYLRSLMTERTGGDDIYETAKNAFIIQQILIIMGFLDVSDEAGRRAVLEVIREFLLDENTSEEVTKHLVKQLFRLHGDDETCLSKITEIVSLILEPIVGKEVVMGEKRRKLDNGVEIVNRDITEGGEFGERNLDDPIGLADMMKLKDDPIKLTRCVLMIQEMLSEERFINHLSPIFPFIEKLIIPGITNPLPDLRNLAITCLGICCIRDLKKIEQYIVIFMQASLIDTEEIRVTSFKCMCNLLHFFGITAISKASKESGNNRKRSQDDNEDITVAACEDEEDDDFGMKILDHVTKNLENESSAVRTVCAEGLAKLLLSARVSSPDLLSRLLLLLYNPVNENDSKMKQCLSAFFPSFAYSCRANQELVGEAFMPTLRTLLDAPTSSPLSKVKVVKVAELMVHLSNFRHQESKVKDDKSLMDKCPHDDIALAICNEILNDPNNLIKVKDLSRTLLMLELSPSNGYLLNSLQVLAKKMVEEVKDKRNKNCLLNFFMSVYEMLKKSKMVDKLASQLDETQIVDEEDREGEHVSTTVSDVVGLVDNLKEATKRTKSAMKNGSKNTQVKSAIDFIESANSSDDFEIPQKRPMREILPRKVKSGEKIIPIEIGKNKFTFDNDDDDDDEDDDCAVEVSDDD